MRKRDCMGIMLALLILMTAGYLYFFRQCNILLQIDEEIPCVEIRVAQSSNRVQMWFSKETEKGYFFLPSCVTDHQVRLGDTGENSVWIDGELYQEGDVFTWEEDCNYQLKVSGASYESYIYEISFLKSENIPAMFIATESGSLEYLHEDKENEETGQICVVREDSSTEYQGDLLRISGKGNSSWEYEKKPYAIKLKDKVPLLGLDQSDRWQLLALWRESSKMDNKIAMDMADVLGIPYTAQGTWVDLYMNGEYRGIYLLAESVTVGEGRVNIYNLEKENKQLNPSIVQGCAVRYEEKDNKGYFIENGTDISGGYLIEKDHPTHWEAESSGFVLSSGAQFTIKAPGHASQEQVDYIWAYVEEIDNMVQNSDSRVWQYLDLDSFVKRFLVDEISLEIDSGLTSMFFYKDRGEDLLYSGPAWDYDRAFGEAGSDDVFCMNYTETIVDNNERVPSVINWYQRLYEMPDMQRRVTEEYAQLLPFFEKLLDSEIDEYASRIKASVKMDGNRWRETWMPDNGMPRYSDYDTNVKYTKFFIANRLNYLCERWGVSHEEFVIPASGEKHWVIFRDAENVVEVVEVADGETLSDIPDYDENVYQGWRFRRNGELYSSYIPIYEDMELYNEKWEQNR